MAVSNLPQNIISQDSSDKVKIFFDSYFTQQISFPAADIDAVTGFFRKRGFDDLASNSTAIILLQQAKVDKVNVFTLLSKYIYSFPFIYLICLLRLKIFHKSENLI